MARTDPQVAVRIPENMMARIRVDAQTSRRSIAGQVLHYLDRVLATDEKKGPAGADTPPGHGLNNALENADGHRNK